MSKRAATSPAAAPMRRGSMGNIFVGYDGLVLRCLVEVRHMALPTELRVNDNVWDLLEAPIDELDPEVTSMCRSELMRLEELRRLEEEARQARADARREAELRREREEQHMKLEAEKAARRRAEEAERERQQRIEQARRELAERERRRAQEIAREREKIEEERRVAAQRRAAQEAQEREAEELRRRREEELRRDESLAKRFAAEAIVTNDEAYARQIAAHPSPPENSKLSRLKSLTGEDDKTCQFFLDCAGGDVEQAFAIWDQNRT